MGYISLVTLLHVSHGTVAVLASPHKANWQLVVWRWHDHNLLETEKDKQRAALVAASFSRDSNELSIRSLAHHLWHQVFIVCTGLPRRGASRMARIIKGHGCVWEMRPSVNEVCVPGEETGGGNGGGRLDPGIQLHTYLSVCMCVFLFCFFVNL